MSIGEVPPHGKVMDDGKTAYCGHCDEFVPKSHIDTCIGFGEPGDVPETDEIMYEAIELYEAGSSYNAEGRGHA